MGDGTRVGVIHNASEVSLGHFNCEREEFWEDSHRIGDVDDLVIFDNLGDEVAWVDEITDNWHADAEDEDIRVVSEHALDQGLGLGVVRAGEVGLVIFFETDAAALGEFIVVVEDATGGKNGEVDVVLEADVSQVEGADDIRTDGLNLVLIRVWDRKGGMG